MISRAKRYIKRLASRLLGMDALIEQVRVLTESIERSNQESNQQFDQQVGALREQVGVVREQVGVLREQVGALREDVSNLSAATNNTSANISLIYDCLIEFDREKRSKDD